MQERSLHIPPKHGKWITEIGDARFLIQYGGASSGKSWSIAAHLVLRFYMEPGVGILILRKTRPAVRKSCYRLVKHWLTVTGQPYRENKSDLTIHSPWGAFIQFDGLDDVEKLKSIEGINYVWMEEATEFTWKDFLQLNIRCRARNLHGKNRIYMTFNPVDPLGNQWLENMTKLRPEAPFLGDTLKVFHCTHGDNIYLSEQEHDVIEALADADEEYNKIYRLGEWATPTAIIYSNWDVVDDFPSRNKLDYVGYGLDFGYVNPTALIKVGVRERDVYIEEAIYETHLHNHQLIDRMGGIITTGRKTEWPIVADSAEPAFIDEIAEAGYNIYPTQKTQAQGAKSFVGTGIDRVKRYNLHITRDSVHTLEEIRGYKWREDKDGNVLPEPVKFRDHAMDAIRYFLGSQAEPVETIVVQTPEWWSAEEPEYKL